MNNTRILAMPRCLNTTLNKRTHAHDSIAHQAQNSLCFYYGRYSTHGSTQERQTAKGKKEGREEGKKDGREEGREDGRADGREGERANA